MVCTWNSNLITCTISNISLEFKAIQNISFGYTVNSWGYKVVSNTATLTSISAKTKTDTTSKTSTVTIALKSMGANISKSVASIAGSTTEKQYAEAGDTVIYNVTITNTGGYDNTSGVEGKTVSTIATVIIEDVFPKNSTYNKGLTLKSVKDNGTALSYSGITNGIKVEFSTSIGFGSTKTITLEYTVDDFSKDALNSDISLENTATLKTIKNEHGHGIDVNKSSKATIYLKHIGATISKAVSYVASVANVEEDTGIRLVECGDTVVFTVTVTNTGGGASGLSSSNVSTIYSVTIKDPHPLAQNISNVQNRGLKFVKTSGATFSSFNESNSTLTFTLNDPIAYNQSTTLTIEYTVDEFTIAELKNDIVMRNTAELQTLKNRNSKSYDINASSYVDVKIKRIGAKVEKSVYFVKAGNNETYNYSNFQTDDNGNILVEEYDTVAFKIAITNTGEFDDPSGVASSNSNKASIIYDTYFEDATPANLTFKTAYLYGEVPTGSGLVWENTNGVTKCTLTGGIGLAGVRNVILEYKVEKSANTPHQISELKGDIVITNYVTLIKTRNRRSKFVTINSTKSAQVKIKRVGAEISKTLVSVSDIYGNTYNEVDPTDNNVRLTECRDIVKYNIAITNTGEFDNPAGITNKAKASTLYSVAFDEEMPTGLTLYKINGEDVTNKTTGTVGGVTYTITNPSGKNMVSCVLTNGLLLGSTQNITFEYKVNDFIIDDLAKDIKIINTAKLKTVTNRSGATYSVDKSRTVPVKLKRTGADLQKTINYVKDYSGNSYNEKDTDNVRLVECGDFVQYNIRIRNTGKYSDLERASLASQGYLQKATRIYNTTFTEIMPTGLTLYKINGEDVTNKTTGNVGGVTYTITRSASENKVVCTLNNYLELNSEKNVTFEYIVNTYTVDELKRIITIENTATLDTVQNRNSKTDEIKQNDKIKVRLKTISANITKVVDAINPFDVQSLWDWDTTKANTPLVECGDLVRYKVTIKNTENAEPQGARIRRVDFLEEIPVGFEFERATPRYSGVDLLMSDYTDASGTKYKNCTLYLTLKPSESTDIYFYYTVKPSDKTRYIGMTKPEHYIYNTANLKLIYNRNYNKPTPVSFEQDKKSTACVRIARYEGTINKYLYRRNNGDIRDSNGNRFDQKIEEAAIHKDNRSTYSESYKEANPYYVEIGDELIYRIVIQNKGEGGFSDVYFDDTYIPSELRYISTIIEYSDNGYGNTLADVNNNSNTGVVTGHIPTTYGKPAEFSDPAEQVKDKYRHYTIPKNKTVILNIRFEVVKRQGVVENLSIFNITDFIKIKNRNNWEFDFNKQSKEHVKEKIYNIWADKYLIDYDKKMLKDNINKKLIDENDENKDYYTYKDETTGNVDRFLNRRKSLTDAQREAEPFAVEKTETVTYKIRIDNKSRVGNKTEDTKITVESVIDYLSEGLEANKGSFVGKIYDKNGAVKQTFTPNIAITNGKISSPFIIPIPSYQLQPEEYIEIVYTATITSQNTNLAKLENKAILTKLTNVNEITIKKQTTDTPDDDTRLNKQKTLTKEYLKLKELVISGWVWNDINKDGLRGNSEPGIGNLVVYLRNPNMTRIVGGDKNHERNVRGSDLMVRTSNDDVYKGLYTFGRIRRTDSSNNFENDMYIEYYYDGIKYQSTLYGGKVHFTDKTNMTYSADYEKDSNAKEKDQDRVNFNDKLKTIYNNQSSNTFDRNENKYTELVYNKVNDNSTIIENTGEKSADENHMISSYSFVRPEYNSNDINKLYMGDVRSKAYQTEYLKHINLGLIARDKIDISIKENIEDITNTVLGDSMGYVLGSSTNDPLHPEFTYYPADYYYKHNDYKNEDIQSALSEHSELTSQITFKAQINNNFKNDNMNNGNPALRIPPTVDDNVVVTVNELALYLDNKYTIQTKPDGTIASIKIKKTKADELYYKADTMADKEEHDLVKAYYINPDTKQKVDLVVYKTTKYETALRKSSQENTTGYTALYIRPKQTGQEIKLPNDGSYVDVYLTFTDCNRSIQNYKIDLGKYNHTLEVNSFSTYYKGEGNYNKNYPTNAQKSINSGEDNYKEDKLEHTGRGAGYVDIDSNPGNIGAENGNSNVYSVKGVNAFGDRTDTTKTKWDEDDTCRGEIKLLVYGETPSTSTDKPKDLVRTINGIVFDDCRSTTSGTSYDTQYVGDGVYNSGSKNSLARSNPLLGANSEQNDTLVPDVKATLFKSIKLNVNGETRYYEINLNDPSQYKVPDKITWVAHTKSGHEGANLGQYTLKGFTPGNYFVRFNYGDTPDGDSNYDREFENAVKYNGQDYKSTTLQNAVGYLNNLENYNITDLNSLRNYRNEMVTYVGEIGKGSKALDDPQRRMETNLYASDVNNVKSEILNSGHNYINNKNSNKKLYKSLADVMLMGTNMFADSIGFYSRAEYVKYDNSQIRNVHYNDRESCIDNAIQYITYGGNERNAFSMGNVNLGLQYRPEAELTLKEYIKEIRLDSQVGNGTQAKTLVDIHYKEDKSLDEGASNLGLDYLLKMPSAYNLGNEEKHTGVKGFQYLNIDEKFLQGSTLYITYGIYVDNTGEIDRVNRKLYGNQDTSPKKSDLIKNMKNAITEYKNKYKDVTTAKYWTDRKTSDNHYKTYLGGTYYYKDYKNIDDTIAQAKVDQFISDLDLDIDFDTQTHGNRWTYYEDLQDIIKGGTYSIIKDYNLKQMKNGIGEGYKLNYDVSNDDYFKIITETLKRNLYLYDEFIEIYGNNGFVKWYEHLVDDFKSQIGTNAANTEKFARQSSLYVQRVLAYTSNYAESIPYRLLWEVNSSIIAGNTNNVNKLLDLKGRYPEMQSILESLSSKVKLYNSGNQMMAFKKTLSLEIEEPVEDIGHNTTYKFTTPDIVFARGLKSKYTLDADGRTSRRVGLDLVTQKVISGDILSTSELSFDNITEITNYTTTNGRRTVYNSVGNGTEGEIDTDETVEIVTLSGPTGLSIQEQKIEKAKYSVEVIIIIGLSILGLGAIIKIYKKKGKK